MITEPFSSYFSFVCVLKLNFSYVNHRQQRLFYTIPLKPFPSFINFFELIPDHKNTWQRVIILANTFIN